ncbi:MAG TPA: hypothetical protein GXX49_07240 [Clostridiaceae bacterium]|jgi:hypothetical protein|nr:hypothetical protein [Clostridiaceae bacterium]
MNLDGMNTKEMAKTFTNSFRKMNVLFALFNMGFDRQLEIKSNIEHILSLPEFKHKPKGKSLIDIIAEFLQDFFRDRKLPNFSLGIDNLSPGLAMLLKLVGITLVVAFIAIIALYLFKTFKRSRKMEEYDRTELVSYIKNPSQVLRIIYECADKGDYKAALRYLYISLLLCLNEMEIIKIEKDKTNSQYLSEILANGFQFYDTIRKFTFDFNRCWYGNKKVDKARFEFWLDNYYKITNGKSNAKSSCNAVKGSTT